MSLLVNSTGFYEANATLYSQPMYNNLANMSVVSENLIIENRYPYLEKIADEPDWLDLSGSKPTRFKRITPSFSSARGLASGISTFINECEKVKKCATIILGGLSVLAGEWILKQRSKI